MGVTTVNPSTGKVLSDYDETSQSDINAMLGRSHQLASHWRTRDATERARSLRTVARTLRGRSDELARLATSEMGKPLAESRAEVEKCAWTCEWYADHSPEMLQPEPVETGAERTQVEF